MVQRQSLGMVLIIPLRAVQRNRKKMCNSFETYSCPLITNQKKHHCTCLSNNMHTCAGNYTRLNFEERALSHNACERLRCEQ